MRNGHILPAQARVGQNRFGVFRFKFGLSDTKFGVWTFKFGVYSVGIRPIFGANSDSCFYQKLLVFKGFSNKNNLFNPARREKQAAIKSPFFPLVIPFYFLPLMVSVKEVV